MQVLLANVSSSVNQQIAAPGRGHYLKEQIEVAKVRPQEAAPSTPLSPRFTESRFPTERTDPGESGGLSKLPEPVLPQAASPLPELLEEIMVDQQLEEIEEKDQSSWAQRRRALAAFVDSMCFEYLTGAIIAANIIMIGIEAELSLTRNEEMSWATNVEQAFLVVYTLELILRMAGSEWKKHIQYLDVFSRNMQKLAEYVPFIYQQLSQVTQIYMYIYLHIHWWM